MANDQALPLAGRKVVFIATDGVEQVELVQPRDALRAAGAEVHVASLDGESIQGLLESALAQLEGAPVVAHGAGRTDAGVHAEGQVASAVVTFAHDPVVVLRALNGVLPADIRVVAVEDRAPDFHARFSARSKTYRYQIRNTAVADPFDRAFVWHVPEPLSLGAMTSAAALLIGTHDFNAFRSAGSEISSPVRTMTRSEWRNNAGLLTASEVATLKLNADWVVLSACNTAAADGTPDAGGLSGLAKAFFYAGARALLVSHWSVPSRATVKLVTGMFDAVVKEPTIGRAEALRRAEMAMLDPSSPPEFAHPLFWAPFVLAGEGALR